MLNSKPWLFTVAFLAMSGVAQTSAANGTIILPGAISHAFFGLNFATNVRTSDTLGTFDYSGQPGCGGVCKATTSLGASPFVSLTVNEVPFERTGGGIASADLGYYVEYLNAPGVYSVDLHAIDSLSGPDGARIAAHLEFGQAGGSPAFFGNFASVTLDETDCVNGCPPELRSFTPAPFAPVHTVQMIANTPYYIQLDVSFRPNSSHVDESALVDPTFSDRGSGGVFAFSQGAFQPSAVPEPSAWLLMLGGLAAVGGMVRRVERARVLAQQAHALGA
jgi:PEP-CTERM motif